MAVLLKKIHFNEKEVADFFKNYHSGSEIMIQYERQQDILKYLKEKNTATVKQLAKIIWTSEATVRRDIEILEKKGLVNRVYGGVILSEYKNQSEPLDLRDTKNSAVKDEIAFKASQHLFDGATVIMDGSSTVRRICKYMGKYKNLKIITNNQRIFSEFGGMSAQIYCTGGMFNPVNSVFTGASAEKFIRSISADILFFSSEGITADGEINDSSEEETALRAAMLGRSKKHIFLCDASKIGIRKTFKLCNKEDIDEIICNEKLPWE